ncbi:MAG: type II toxin-antitoxin system PemK/MazF family toxin [Thermodesulfovibrionia bacterium]|nr:type II toxin-antitoxin system PemK/MazF family toxin [Thermodesulfovibrionia bacterium]
MDVKQGDIYWVDFGISKGSEPGYRHPHVVIQNNIFNESKINTVVVCALTSNLKWAKSPGNVLLKKSEGNLPKDSVVNVTQVETIDKSFLFEKIGALPASRVKQIIEGIKLLIEPREI